MREKKRVRGIKLSEGRRWEKEGDDETFHWTNFDLSLLAGQCCNKLQVVKSLDTSWHPLQKKPEFLPVSFRFSTEDGRVVVQLLLRASTSGWQHLGWNWDFACPKGFLRHLYEHPLQRPPVFWPYLSQYTPQPHNPRLSPSHPWFPNPELQRRWNLNAKHLECLPIPGLCERWC